MQAELIMDDPKDSKVASVAEHALLPVDSDGETVAIFKIKVDHNELAMAKELIVGIDGQDVTNLPIFTADELNDDFLVNWDGICPNCNVENPCVLFRDANVICGCCEEILKRMDGDAK